MRPASAVEHRMAPPCTVAVRTSPVFGTNISASSPSTNTAVWPRKCAATTGASALNGRVRSTTEGISLLVSVTARSALFWGCRSTEIARTLHGCARLLKGAAPGTVTRARGPSLSRHHGPFGAGACYQLLHELAIDYLSSLWYGIHILAQRGVF